MELSLTSKRKTLKTAQKYCATDITKVSFTSNDGSNPLHNAFGIAPGYCNIQMDTTINCSYYETGAQFPTYGMLSGTFTYYAGRDVEVQFSGLFLRKSFASGSAFQATAEEMLKSTVTCNVMYLW